ncbi:hypothetical protein [Sphingobacterium sp. 2149]|uniref:hypothetical protein n=1 Tax=Sphingobacterium sp. 2149 TaxID=2817763 RepID=UPI002856BFD7|nr:hypothetical protein [Sphingobacterium sp. 2149]MDR6734816.1 hypothetical protein [Sphingobacterium sp. 2149]
MNNQLTIVLTSIGLDNESSFYAYYSEGNLKLKGNDMSNLVYIDMHEPFDIRMAVNCISQFLSILHTINPDLRNIDISEFFNGPKFMGEANTKTNTNEEEIITFKEVKSYILL